MSSIQDRIRRLESGAGDGGSAAPSGAVAAAKARFARGASADVSNIASRFKGEVEDAPVATPSVAALRERVQAPAASVSARAAMLAARPSESGSARVSARRDALESRGDAAALSARTDRFERAASTSTEDSRPLGLIALRSGKFDGEQTRPHTARAALQNRAAIFEKPRSEDEAPAKKPPALVPVAPAEPQPSKTAKAPALGRVASAAKDRELHEVRAELADMVSASKELLSELARLRAAMQDMERSRDALLKRVNALERKAK